MRTTIRLHFKILGVIFLAPLPSFAFFWNPMDTLYLSQIVANSIQQLKQMEDLYKTGSDELNMVRDINRGINDSLEMAETLGVRIDPGLYRDLHQVDEAVSEIEKLYGAVTNSQLSSVQRNTDKTAAEAITFNNDLNEYAAKLDIIGEEIKRASHQVSPGGATKLTAQSLGVLIHVTNQQLRATGQGLKLQAQAMAIQNKKEKDETTEYLKEGQNLSQKMKTLDANFQAPRF